MLFGEVNIIMPKTSNPNLGLSKTPKVLQNYSSFLMQKNTLDIKTTKLFDRHLVKVS